MAKAKTNNATQGTAQVDPNTAKAEADAKAQAQVVAEAEAKAEAEKKAAEEKAAEEKAKLEAVKKGKKIDILYVKAKRGSFRRAGFSFDEAGMDIQRDTLTDEQIDALRNETMLVVEEGTIDATEAEATEQP